MTYALIYWVNLGFACTIMALTYYLAVNEVKRGKRFWDVFLSMSCAIEVTILFFYLPRSLTDVLQYTPDLMVTLLLAKLVLKPALAGSYLYAVLDQRGKINRSRPHGQEPAVLPQSLERVERNREAAAKGKIDQAIDTAKALHAEHEAVRKLTDSDVRGARREAVRGSDP